MRNRRSTGLLRWLSAGRTAEGRGPVVPVRPAGLRPRSGHDASAVRHRTGRHGSVPCPAKAPVPACAAGPGTGRCAGLSPSIRARRAGPGPLRRRLHRVVASAVRACGFRDRSDDVIQWAKVGLGQRGPVALHPPGHCRPMPFDLFPIQLTVLPRTLTRGWHQVPPDQNVTLVPNVPRGRKEKARITRLR